MVNDYFHYSRVFQLFADFPFSLEPLEKKLVALHIRMRHFDRNLPARSFIGSAIYRGYITASDDAINAVMTELVARIDLKTSSAALCRQNRCPSDARANS